MVRRAPPTTRRMSIDQGGPKRHALGVDFGTSNTVAVARWPDGRPGRCLFDGSPLLPSAVYAEPGRHSSSSAATPCTAPASTRPASSPTRSAASTTALVLLGERELPVVDADRRGAAAGSAEEWRRTVGRDRPDVTAHLPGDLGRDPAAGCWPSGRRRAGLGGARLVAEPVAAATYFAQVLGRDVPVGSVVVVHDFGAGTFDASVVARTAAGFEVLAVDGRDDIGGLDVDTLSWQGRLGARHADRRPGNGSCEPETVRNGGPGGCCGTTSSRRIQRTNDADRCPSRASR